MEGLLIFACLYFLAAGVLACIVCAAKSAKEAKEAKERKENPELYLRLKEMQHEKSMKDRETGKALGGLAASLIAKKYLK